MSDGVVIAPPTAEVTTSAWLRRATGVLRGTSTSAHTDAELILGAVLDLSRSHVVTHPTRQLGSSALAQADALLQRRRAGEPIAYLLGEWEFWSLALTITRDVLVPRPETEGIVECGLQVISGCARPRILDLGTGSGAIALALAHERPDAQVVATDCSVAALDVAHANAQRLGLELRLLAGSWYTALKPGVRFELIVSNPPYVAGRDPQLEPAVARYEPAAALFGGPAGTEALREVIRGAGPFLAPGGHLVVEHGATQAPQVLAMMRAGGFAAVSDARDLAGLPRVAVGCWPAA